MRSALHPRGAALKLKLLWKGCSLPHITCELPLVCEATPMQAKLRRSVAWLWGLKQLLNVTWAFLSLNIGVHSIVFFIPRAKVLEKTQEASRLGQPCISHFQMARPISGHTS